MNKYKCIAIENVILQIENKNHKSIFGKVAILKNLFHTF